jgi:hypothetical protein
MQDGGRQAARDGPGAARGGRATRAAAAFKAAQGTNLGARRVSECTASGGEGLTPRMRRRHEATCAGRALWNATSRWWRGRAQFYFV